ncbi:hypothetical protein ILUMI_21857 [Ignelater luminosus]|uniref:Uncharacterized protein n=1 Tax=Ignelater luminosus TaxID=2038154 RepID=A0A8K0CDS8_IGNLU|nr:hypothetical protein ILUMI_21857 [Ignelater luminosus]
MAKNSDIGDNEDPEDDFGALEVHNSTIPLRSDNNDLLTDVNINNIRLPDSDNDSDIATKLIYKVHLAALGYFYIHIVNESNLDARQQLQTLYLIYDELKATIRMLIII